jgi:hypothetical protein
VVRGEWLVGSGWWLGISGQWAVGGGRWAGRHETGRHGDWEGGFIQQACGMGDLPCGLGGCGRGFIGVGCGRQAARGGGGVGAESEVGVAGYQPGGAAGGDEADGAGTAVERVLAGFLGQVADDDDGDLQEFGEPVQGAQRLADVVVAVDADVAIEEVSDGIDDDGFLCSLCFLLFNSDSNQDTTKKKTARVALNCRPGSPPCGGGTGAAGREVGCGRIKRRK